MVLVLIVLVMFVLTWNACFGTGDVWNSWTENSLLVWAVRFGLRVVQQLKIILKKEMVAAEHTILHGEGIGGAGNPSNWKEGENNLIFL